MASAKISGLEAHFLLFAMDNYLGVDANGHILSAKNGFTRTELQSLRDKLFNAHEHRPGEYDDDRLVSALTPDQYEALTRALEAAPSPSEKLKQLMAHVALWEKNKHD